MAGWRGLSFDLDGTLVDRRAAVRAQLGSVLESTALEEALALDDGGGNQALFRYLQRRAGFASEARARSWFLRGWPRRLEPNPALRAALHRLRARYRLVVISNGGPRQRDKLAASGLAECFELVLFSSEPHSAKPRTTMFRRAERWLGCEANQMLHVGDQLDTDVAGARAAGWASCWVAPAGADPGEARPDFRIASLHELEAVLG